MIDLFVVKGRGSSGDSRPGKSGFLRVHPVIEDPQILDVFEDCAEIPTSVRMSAASRIIVGKVLAIPLRMTTTAAKAKRSARLGRLARSARGAAYTEYLVTVAFFGIVVGAAVASRTQMVLVDFANSRDLLFLPSM